MDKFKCEECGQIFEEFDADYNFMSITGKELCSKCIKQSDYISGKVNIFLKANSTLSVKACQETNGGINEKERD